MKGSAVEGRLRRFVEDKVGRLPILVAHLANERQYSRLRRVFERALDRHQYVSLHFADAVSDRELALTELRPHVDRAFICFFDLSNRAATAPLVELGYALGRHRYCVLLHRRQSRPRSGLLAHDRLIYSSLEDLTEMVRDRFPQYVGAAIREYSEARRSSSRPEDFANIDARLFTSVGSLLLRADIWDPSQAAEELGMSDIQMRITVAVLESFGIAKQRGQGVGLTEFGRSNLPGILAGALRQKGREQPSRD